MGRVSQRQAAREAQTGEGCGDQPQRGSPFYGSQVLGKQLMALGEKAQDKYVKELKRMAERPCAVIATREQEVHHAYDQQPPSFQRRDDRDGETGDEEARQVPVLHTKQCTQ